MERSKPRPEILAAGLLALLVLGLFAPAWARGLMPFWGDLTYLHLPWQQATTQCLQAGKLPLWDPFLFFGMPMAANMQRAVFYPGEIPFRIFGFATAEAGSPVGSCGFGCEPCACDPERPWPEPQSSCRAGGS
jgi:hypothetical protein